MPTFTRITQITAFLATVATTVPACVDGNVIFTSTQGGEESGGEPGDSSSGQGATSTSGGSSDTADSGSSSESSGDSSTVQCDINIEGDLPVSDEQVFSPCYHADAFYCWSCAAWCDGLAVIGIGPCQGVLVSSTCIDPLTEEAVVLDICDDEIATSVATSPFRCICST